MIGTTETSAEVDSELFEAVLEAKCSDPLVPLTVVCPSGYAAVQVRRNLASAAESDRTAGIANLNATFVSSLVKRLAAPALAARDLRPASSMVFVEATRAEALERGGWAARFALHHRSLEALVLSLRELGGCPTGALEVISSQSARAAELVGLLRKVRARLEARGFTDEHGVARAARRSAEEGVFVSQLGNVIAWDLGRCTGEETAVLEALGARTIASQDHEKAQPAGFTEVLSCADSDEEARSVVRSVVRAVEEGTPLWRQAVFHPASTIYPRLLRQHLQSAGIPSCGHGRRRLTACVASRLLLGFMELAANGWARDEVVGWMTSVPIARDRDGHEIPAVSWDVASAEAGVIAGAEQWTQRLMSRARHNLDDTGDPVGLSAFVSELVHHSEPLGSSWADHSRWAVGLLERFLVPTLLRNGWPSEEQAASAKVIDVLRALSDLDEVSDGTDLASFKAALRGQLERTEVDPGEGGGGAFGDGVFLSPLHGAAGLHFDQVVVCGLADAIVPGPTRLDSLLGEELRAADTSGTLRTRKRAHEELRGDLARALRAGTRSRVATFPRSDRRTGRDHVGSRWLHETGAGATPKTVASFAASLADDGPAVDARDLDLRGLDRWVSLGADASLSPVVRADPTLESGFEAVRSRAASAFTRFDGYVGDARVSPFDPVSPVSATRFETYAQCPRRFLLERALGVTPRLLPEELWRIEPLERGSLVHEILEEYVAERIGGAPRSLERLLATAERHLDAAEERGLVGRPLLWRMDRAAIVRDLRRFHLEEGDLQPLAVELTFGSEADLESPPVVVRLDDGREVRFRGSADRVDRSASGRLVVSDYKTGRQTRLAQLVKDPVASGTLLQLPLYGLAARDRFGSQAPVHARYWLLSSERSASFYNLSLTDPVEARFKEVIGRIASGIEAGCFPGIPGPALYDGRFEKCRNCDFDRLCPPHRDRQWSLKASDPKLDDVVALVRDEGEGRLSGSVVKGFVDPDRFEIDLELPDGEGISR